MNIQKRQAENAALARMATRAFEAREMRKRMIPLGDYWDKRGLFGSEYFGPPEGDANDTLGRSFPGSLGVREIYSLLQQLC